MPTRISATDLSRKLSDVLSRVQYRGESFLIERNGAPIGVLRPASEATPTWPALAERLRGRLTSDDTLADDLETVQREQGEPEMPPGAVDR